MTIRDFGAAGSCAVGIAVARALTTMSIGFSSTVFRASTFTTSFCGSGIEVCSLIALSVISASGVPGMFEGSGDAEGFGVGNGGESSGRSGATETRLFLAGRTLFLFTGERGFDGDTGSGATPSGLKSCDGSTESPVLVLRVRVAVRGVGGSSVVLRRGALRALFCGAGVNSSSLPSFCGAWFSSSSDESMIGAFRREAAARVDFRGDTVDILVP